MRIHSSWRDYPRAILGLAEVPLVRWFERNVGPNETWIDVGAHHGVTALALSKCVGPRGRVFAFEPVLASAGLLARTRETNRLNQLVIVPMALGDVAELSGLRVSSQVQGMIGITPGMRDGTSPPDFGEVIWEISLDSIWPGLSRGDDRLSGLKIDAQGAESHVLRGMSETLRKHKPRLIVEYHRYADLTEFLDVLDAVGYSRVGQDIDLPSAAETSRLVHGHNYEFPAITPASGA